MSLILRPCVFHERLSPRSQETVWHVGAMQAFQEKWCRCSWVGEQILFFVVLETFESFYIASTFQLPPPHSSANPVFLLSHTDVSWIQARRRIDVSRASVLLHVRVRLKYWIFVFINCPLICSLPWYVSAWILFWRIL